MTENMKKFLEEVSKNEELCKKLNSADQETIIAMAGELGMELTEADFAQNNALSDDELDAVAGGYDSSCGCILGGAGRVGLNTTNEKLCVCVAGGGGEYTDGTCRCACVGLGFGEEGD